MCVCVVYPNHTPNKLTNTSLITEFSLSHGGKKKKKKKKKKIQKNVIIIITIIIKKSKKLDKENEGLI